MRAAALAALAAAASLSGCALAPGLRMDEGAAVSRGRETTKNDEFRIEPITPALILKLGDPARARPLTPDPLAGTPPAPYTIAPFDVLHVTVWDHPELTTPTGQFRSPEENGNPVGPDGTVFYPYAGVLHVAGKTVVEVRTLLLQRLAAVIAKPQLDVRIAGYRGKRVQVTGEVTAPGPMPITELPLTVQDAIAFARGFTAEADLTSVTLTRGGKVHRLDLLALYERGELSQNWRLLDGDVVNVPDRNRNTVFVLGEVGQQQAKRMVKRRMTLAEAIGDAGGFDPLASNTGNVYVIRGDYAAPAIFRLDASSADALLLATRFELEPLDIVYVSTNALVRWNRVLSQILPTVQALFQTSVLVDIARREATR